MGRRDLQRRAAGLSAVAGYGLAIGAEEGEVALAGLELVVTELGVPPPTGVRDSVDPVGALEEWAAVAGVFHRRGRCERHRDGHWACHC